MNTKQRNIIGSIVTLVLSIILGGIGIAIMMIREVYQSNKYKFPIEKDDITRYSIIGAIGSTIQLIVLILLILK